MFKAFPVTRRMLAHGVADPHKFKSAGGRKRVGFPIVLNNDLVRKRLDRDRTFGKCDNLSFQETSIVSREEVRFRSFV
jgi:hypothetical protein